MSNLVQKVVKTLREMLSVRAENAMRTKVVVIGLDGCERHLVQPLRELIIQQHIIGNLKQ